MKSNTAWLRIKLLYLKQIAILKATRFMYYMYYEVKDDLSVIKLGYSINILEVIIFKELNVEVLFQEFNIKVLS